MELNSFDAEKMAPIDTPWHLLSVYKPNSGCEQNELVGGSVFSSGDRVSGSPLLMQTVVSVAHRLLFTTDENAQLMVVTMMKNSVL